MYINDLGIGRIASDHSVKAGSTIRRKDTDRYADYAAVMKKAVDRQATTVNPAFTCARTSVTAWAMGLPSPPR